jgi:putative copper resistance protein D
VASDISAPPAPAVPRRARAALTPLLVVLGALAALVAAGLTVASGGQHYAALGLPDAGPFTEDGLAALGAITELAAAVTVGSLLLAAFLVPPNGKALAADGYAAVRTAGWAAVVWCVATIGTLPFTVADELGRPVYHLTFGALFPLAFQLEQPTALVVTAGITLLLAIGCWLALSWGATASLFLLALLGLAPLAVTGHSSAGGSHDIATDSLLLHLGAASVWVGGLVALLAHARRGGAHLALATRRFSACALVCWVVMAVSGVVNALVRLPPHDLFTTGYGLMVLAKITALFTLGALGFQQRRRAVRLVAETAGRRALLTLSAVELLVMALTFGVSAALSRTAPPADGVTAPSIVDVLVGYDLPAGPTLTRLLFAWRFDLLYGTLALVLAALYLEGVRTLRRRGQAWPVGRTAAWLVGCLLILVATSSGIGRYAPAMFSVHMASQLTLMVLAPAFLVRGGATILARQALPAEHGPADWLRAAVDSPVARFLRHPLVAFPLFAGSAFALYFTGLFDSALTVHWAHLVMNGCFLLIGLAFFAPIIGLGARPPYLVRLGLLLAAMPCYAIFGIVLSGRQSLVGHDFYQALGLPWADPAADQRLAAIVAWGLSEIPLVLLVILLLARWPNRPSVGEGG